MKTWTVQCVYPLYYPERVIVTAETLEDALKNAIEKVSRRIHSHRMENGGEIFVEAAAEGRGTYPWRNDQPFSSVLPIPERFTEYGKKPAVTVIVSGGAVQNVIIEGGPVRVQVHDYDTEGADPGDPRVRADENGDRYELGEWR